MLEPNKIVGVNNKLELFAKRLLHKSFLGRLIALSVKTGCTREVKSQSARQLFRKAKPTLAAQIYELGLDPP